MKTYVKVGLGLAGGVAVGLGVLYFLGKKKMTVTDPKAVDSADIGQTIAAGWTTVIGTVMPTPPRGGTTTAGEVNVDGKGEPIVNNLHSAVTERQMATAGMYANSKLGG